MSRYKIVHYWYGWSLHISGTFSNGFPDNCDSILKLMTQVDLNHILHNIGIMNIQPCLKIQSSYYYRTNKSCNFLIQNYNNFQEECFICYHSIVYLHKPVAPPSYATSWTRFHTHDFVSHTHYTHTTCLTSQQPTTRPARQHLTYRQPTRPRLVPLFLPTNCI